MESNATMVLVLVTDEVRYHLCDAWRIDNGIFYISGTTASGVTVSTEYLEKDIDKWRLVSTSKLK